MIALRGVLLDVDGTLIDSNDAHAMAWVDVFAERGIFVPFEEVRPLIGMGGDKLLWQLAHIPDGSTEGAAISHRRSKIFLDNYLPSLRPAPGARELLSRFLADGLTLTVATSAQQSEISALLRQANIDDLVTLAATSSDAERSKPDPDIVHAAIARSELRPAELLMLGDTPYDVEAARRAGVATVAVTCGGWDAASLDAAMAIYENPLAIVRDYEDSPFRDRQRVRHAS